MNKRILFAAGILTIAVVLLASCVWFFFVARSPDDRPVATEQQAGQFRIAVAAMQAQDDLRAQTILQQLVTEMPNEPAVWGNLALAHLRTNDLQRAAEALEQARQLRPEDPQLIQLQARVAERNGELETAIALLEQVPDPSAEVLFMQSQLLDRLGTPEAQRQRFQTLGQILARRPDDVLVHFQRAQLAARLQRQAELIQSLQAVSSLREVWPEGARQYYQAALQAAEAGQFEEAATNVTFLENLSKRTARYQESVAALDREREGMRPLTQPRRFTFPPLESAPADRSLSFRLETPSLSPEPQMVWALPLFPEEGYSLITLTEGSIRLSDSISLPLPEEASSDATTSGTVVLADLNLDFRRDVIACGSAGLLLYRQDEAGQFTAVPPQEDLAELWAQPCTDVWPLDLEADGDLDLLIGRPGHKPTLLQNNGDWTFAINEALSALPPVRELRMADLDGDGDVDLAALDQDNRLLVLLNERSGRYQQPSAPLGQLPLAGLAVGDVDHDGRFGLVALDLSGKIHHVTMVEGDWKAVSLAEWTSPPEIQRALNQGRVSLWLADMDNNGAIDIIASSGNSVGIWLGDFKQALQPLVETPALFVSSVADVDQDGRLDLVGINAAGEPQVAYGQSAADYQWLVLRPQANPNTGGDSRINSYGLGGEVAVRAGNLLQLRVIDQPIVHLGLGRHQQTDLVRIVWPNGAIQSEFGLAGRVNVGAQQRLTGSCPFVFTYDGSGWSFLKDFLWRSPLGLRINAQETAGVIQTEDWIKIPGSKMRPREGYYEVRITAELWETHFFDMVHLMVVDHPPERQIDVDERFIATRSPALELVSHLGPQPLRGAWDDQGQNMSEVLQQIDGRYVDSFALGHYQGIAGEHWLELELPADIPAAKILLLGHGWVYPTDSSLNVAISQRQDLWPQDLSLDVWEDGQWRNVSSRLGFPAGKNKTVLLELPSDALQQGLRRFRLRTNLEVYWDYLGWTVATEDESLQVVRSEPARAELRYRGFSQMLPLDRRRPDTPVYDRLAGVLPRWRDLEGFHTRFGDVRPLLTAVDDRYVIMNAGDELVLRFPVAADPPAGWERDFVLIGDGWVKDGNLNTAFSKTVLPLPSHSTSDYSRPPTTLADDPVYQQHAEDWQQYHTRYVRPQRFSRGLWYRAAEDYPLRLVP